MLGTFPLGPFPLDSLLLGPIPRGALQLGPFLLPIFRLIVIRRETSRRRNECPPGIRDISKPEILAQRRRARPHRRTGSLIRQRLLRFRLRWLDHSPSGGPVFSRYGAPCLGRAGRRRSRLIAKLLAQLSRASRLGAPCVSLGRSRVHWHLGIDVLNGNKRAQWLWRRARLGRVPLRLLFLAQKHQVNPIRIPQYKSYQTQI